MRGDGVVVAWGSLLAIPPAATNIIAIAAGGSDALALQDGGILIPWGDSYYGQASAPASAIDVVGLAAGGDHNIVLLADGTIAAWGANYSGQTSVPTQATNIVAISAGGAHSLALAGTPQVNMQAVLGSSVLLTAGSLGGDGDSFQWQLNGLNLAGATNATLGIDSVTWTNAGVYRVIVSNVGGLTIGPPIVLAVLPAPLRFDTAVAGLQATNSTLHLRLLGASGLGPVVIYASSDLLTWQPIYTNPPVIGPVEFDDAGITNSPVRFYRASEAR